MLLFASTQQEDIGGLMSKSMSVFALRCYGMHFAAFGYLQACCGWNFGRMKMNNDLHGPMIVFHMIMTQTSQGLASKRYSA